MNKWADYLISAVRFNATGSHIDKVKTHKDDGQTVGVPSEMERSTVVSYLKLGKTFCTIFMREGKWQKGAMVKIDTIYGQDYITTRADGTKRDNLDNLPPF